MVVRLCYFTIISSILPFVFGYIYAGAEYDGLSLLDFVILSTVTVKLRYMALFTTMFRKRTSFSYAVVSLQ